MKKYVIAMIVALLFCGFTSPPAVAQFDLIKKIKKKAEDKAEDKAVERIFGEEENAPPRSKEPEKSNDRPSNKRGGGLTHEPPDVLMNIDDAEKSFSGKKYADARFAIRQAIMGIELTIGNNILDNLPKAIDGLPALHDEDQVASSGIGFVGLIIERTYREGDRQMKVTIGNDASLLSAVNMYLASRAHYSTTDEDNHKIVKIGDDRAVLEYDEYSGYKLSLPFGQSSVLITEGLNFENEQQIIAATEEIDINHIKKELGEQ